MIYRNIKVCSSCNERLSDREVYYSNGTCPRCGATASGTIVNYQKVVIEEDDEMPKGIVWGVVGILSLFFVIGMVLGMLI